MWAKADESSAWILDLYRRSWTHAAETFAATDLDTTGTVSWWPEEVRHPTLRFVLMHMTNETARHAGHLDILRELVDGSAGRYHGDGSIAGPDDFDWATYRAKIEAAAVEASSTDG